MNASILNLTAVAEVFPEGQKITTTILEFDRVIDNEKLTPDLFSVKNRTITKIYANDLPLRAEHGKNGPYVLIELALEDAEAQVLPKPSAPPPGAPAVPAAAPANHSGFFPRIPLRVRKPLQVILKQLGDLVAADGTILTASEAELVSNKTSQPIVEDFRQSIYKGLPYNLFIPKNYDQQRSYPLVMFIGDASTNSDNPLVSLVQGLGGIVWASPAEQSKHPCFVLVPQIPYGTPLTRDDFSVSPELETIMELLEKIVSRYNIDRKRIYATGQSQGCMAACELNVRYPDYFAASLLVSGQWNPTTMATTLTGKNLFIALSAGGPKEFPGMNAVVAALEAAGAKVARASLNARKSQAELRIDINELIATGAKILYAVYDAKTVLPNDGQAHPPIAHHSRGWEITYAIEAVRDWLFSQVKGK